MTKTKSSIRTLIGTAALLIATSLATVYGSEPTGNAAHAASAKTLPGAAASVDPCSPKKTNGPLGY